MEASLEILLDLSGLEGESSCGCNSIIIAHVEACVFGISWLRMLVEAL